jgi:cardiolipin synthase
MHPLRYEHGVTLLHSGVEYFPALIADIQASQTEIRFETYIFHFDVAGLAVATALEAAAQRGVAVYLMVDGIGTPLIPPEWVERFDRAGVQWYQFLPLGVLGILIPGRWRRLHRKLCVVDNKVLFCGGINVLDDFFELGRGPQTTPRLDFAVRVTGPLVVDARRTMLQFWQRFRATRQFERGNLVAAKKELLHQPVAELSAPETVGNVRGDSFGAAHDAPKKNGIAAALVLRDNVRNRVRIERAYRQAIAHARHDVLIANAYFLPGGKLRRALIHAARRGVRVRLLLQGKYEYFMQYHAAKAFYRSLTDAGVEIYEYHAGFMHAKVAVIDSSWATVGSSNLDPLSLLLAREANVVLENAMFAEQLKAAIDTAINTQSVRMDVGDLNRRPWSQRGKDWVAYTLMRLTLFLTGKDY